VLAASRPRSLALAGSTADGVLISAATSAPFARVCLDRVEAGAAGRPLRKLGIIHARLGATETEAMDGVRKAIGFVLRGRHHAENIRLSGAPLDQAALAAAFAAEDWAHVDRLVSDEVVRPHAACGSAAQVKARLDEYRAIGLDELIIGGVDDAKEVAAMLALARGRA
jgi:5,10-methylenetetrahydromethanopterin reductase